MSRWLTCGDSRTLRQLAAQQDSADEKVEGAKDGVATYVTNMLLVLKTEDDEERPGKRGLRTAQNHAPLSTAQLLTANEADDELKRTRAERPHRRSRPHRLDSERPSNRCRLQPKRQALR